MFINPIDDEKRQIKTQKVFEERVIQVKEKQAYDKRMRLYRINSNESLIEALKDTKQMNRIPLFLRTPKNNIEMNEIFKRVVYYLHLPEDISEINLRKIFSESY